MWVGGGGRTVTLRARKGSGALKTGSEGNLEHKLQIQASDGLFSWGEKGGPQPNVA